jgi:hypothetical protein
MGMDLAISSNDSDGPVHRDRAGHEVLRAPPDLLLRVSVLGRVPKQRLIDASQVAKSVMDDFDLEEDDDNDQLPDED